jgi:hypothetical protein
VTLTGKLSALRGSVAKQTVTVQRQVDGSTAPSTATTLTTDRNGGFAYTFEPRSTAKYLVSYAGKDALGAASSDSVRVTVKVPSATKIDLIANRTRIASGSHTAVHGHLLTTSGHRVAHERIVLFRRSVGSSNWVRVQADLTSGTGYWRVLIGPRDDMVYRVTFPGTPKYLTSKSRSTRVHVR